MQRPAGLIARNLLWRSAYFGSVLLVNVVIARSFAAARSGEIFFIVGNLSLLILLLSFSLESAVVYQLSRQLARPAQIVRFLLGWTAAMLVLLVLILPLLLPHIPARFHAPHLRLAILLFVGGVLLTTYFSAVFYGLHRFQVSNGVLAVANIALAGVTLFCNRYEWFDRFFLLIYFGSFLVQGLALLFVWLFSRTAHTRSTDPQLRLRPFFRYAGLALLANMVYFLVNRIDYWFVEQFCSPGALGNYIQASKFAQMLVVVPSIAASSLFPLIASGKIQPGDPDILRGARVLGWGTLLVFVPVTAGGYWLFPLIYGRSFGSMYRLLLLLMPGVCCMAANYPLTALNSAQDRVKRNVKGALLALAFIVAGDFFLIPIGGVAVAAIMSSAGQFAYFGYVLHQFMEDNPGYRLKEIVSLSRADIAWLYRFLGRPLGDNQNMP